MLLSGYTLQSALEHLLGMPGVNDQQSTRLESAEEIRRWHRAQQQQPMTAELLTARDDDTKLFVPRQRPPLAMVCLLDDGKNAGEWIRIRSSSLTIGRDRSKADIAIEFDAGISSRHLEIAVFRANTGQWQWRVRDLNSTNGTFARVSSAILQDNQDILIGASRLRFTASRSQGKQGPSEDPLRAKTTQQWQAVREGTVDSPAAQIHCIDHEPPETFVLRGAENWIGRDAGKCSIVLGGDPFVSPVHAKVTVDENGRWRITNAGAKNGTWVRVDELLVQRRGEFQIGEQRLIVRVIREASS